jgi:hypothetical protein
MDKPPRPICLLFLTCDECGFYALAMAIPIYVIHFNNPGPAPMGRKHCDPSRAVA